MRRLATCRSFTPLLLALVAGCGTSDSTRVLPNDPGDSTATAGSRSDSSAGSGGAGGAGTAGSSATGSGAGENGGGAAASGGSSGQTQSLVDFYEERSMLYQAEQYSIEVVGDRDQWNGQYLAPEEDAFTDQAAEFLTIYPRAILPSPDQSVIGTLAEPSLWDALEEIGITLMHPVAFERAGQLEGREYSPSIDGGFDRISMEVEPALGNDEDVRQLTRAASEHDALIAGDIIPLHTGLGADFRLAQMNYRDYPGIYDMIEVPEEDWDLLPPVEEKWGYEVITLDQAEPLLDAGYMPGTFDVLLGAEESVNWSGWAATAAVEGVDGKTRRWIYAHLFKPQQPTLNWMDPTYAGRRTQTGDAVRHVHDLGVKVNRLDAVPFLALNPQSNGDGISYYNTTLAISGTDDLAYMHRKLGGWTWVELNSPTGDYLRFMENGADLGYDFFTRAQTVHPLIAADARVLRVAHRSVLESGVPHSGLIHALQNHDEIAYQLINLSTQEQVQFGDETLTGPELQERTLEEMRSAVAGEAAPYNALYRPENNGVATTFAGFIAPTLGIDPYSATPDEVQRIEQAHVMLAHVNAMQPGVFALSQWDLVGALPIERSAVEERIAEGDMRWLNRGSVDLMGASSATESSFGLPEAQALYGPLSEQLDNAASFARRVADIISARKRFDISDAEVVAVPSAESNAAFVLVMSLPEEVGGVAVTAANYGTEPITVTVDLSEALGSTDVSGQPFDIVSRADAGGLTGTELTLPLPALAGRTVAIGATPLDDGDPSGGGSSGGGSGASSGSGSSSSGSGASG